MKERGGRWRAAIVAAALVMVAACTAAPSEQLEAPAGSGASATATTGSTSPPTAAPGAAVDPVSLPALISDDISGTRLRLGRALARTDSYVRHAVSYRADDLTITGVMNVPRGDGPFPVVVLLHGHIDEDVYVTGQGFRREQDSLARNGYVAFHVDYRNHAGSDEDPDNDAALRLGYTRDAVAAVEAVKASKLPFLDPERVAILGRSMGGGVAYNVLVSRPGLVAAAVVYASVSTDTTDNYNRWIRNGDGNERLVARIEGTHGSPETNPQFWAGVSPRTYVNRITEPVLVHHGVQDDTCPIRWTRATVAALKQADVELTYHEYPGEGHYFLAGWSQSMRRTLAFLAANLSS